MDRFAPVASLTLMRYPARWVPRAILGMATDRLPLSRTPGLRFYRLLGTGQGAAFDPWADPARWGLFGVWETMADLERFVSGPGLYESYRRRSLEDWTVALAPVRWRGRWGGRDPFEGFKPAKPPEGPWAVLTRATVRPSRLPAFWGAVPAAARALAGHPDLIASVGVGESPFVHQATFSLWRGLPDMTRYAYAEPAHLEAVRRTREENWYAEELFARFAPLRSWGTWDGRDPLAP